MESFTAQILLFLFAIIGYVFSHRTWVHLKRQKKDTDELTIFGLALSTYGIIYYVGIILYCLYAIVTPVDTQWYVLLTLLIVSSMAVLVAAAFLIKAGVVHKKFDLRAWVFSVLNAVIFFMFLLTYNTEMILSSLETGREFMVMVHLFAMVLGLGGATYSDILLIRFLKDFKISAKESEVIKTLSDAIWVGVGLAIISGFGLFIIKADELLISSKFQAKSLIFLILVINGALLHLYLLPHLMKFSFHEKDRKGRKHQILRTAGFIAGPISIISWYSVFVLGSFREVPMSFGLIMSLYCAILLASITLSLIVEARYKHQARKHAKK
jgi:hypothetical protein